MFESLVDDETNIPKIENLYHLKEEAEEVFASIFRKFKLQTHVRVLLNLPVIAKDFLLIEIINQKLNVLIREKRKESSCECIKPTFKENSKRPKRLLLLKNPKIFRHILQTAVATFIYSFYLKISVLIVMENRPYIIVKHLKMKTVRARSLG